MAYITAEDLEDELGKAQLVKLTCDEKEATEPDEKVIEKAIGYAISTFERYARTRYSLPVTPTLGVKSLCLDLAIYKLYARRATSSAKEGVFSVKQTAHDAAIKELANIASGKAALDVPAVQETIEKPATSDRILTNASRTKLTDNALSNF